MFVRGVPEDASSKAPDLDPPLTVEHVEFELHPDFVPATVVVREPPFQITREGWGTFDVGVKIYFTDGTQKTLSWQLSFQGDGAHKDLSVTGTPVEVKREKAPRRESSPHVEHASLLKKLERKQWGAGEELEREISCVRFLCFSTLIFVLPHFGAREFLVSSHQFLHLFILAFLGFL